jgi:DNA/RNA endonuclease YhcR with UshA esterase domain
MQRPVIWTSEGETVAATGGSWRYKGLPDVKVEESS